MATEGCRAADLDGAHDPQLLQGKVVAFAVSGAMESKVFGHFESGPWHPGYLRGLGRGGHASASSGLEVPAMTCVETLV